MDSKTKLVLSSVASLAKALELFLADIVSAAAAETKSKGSRKVTAYHLKRAIHTTPTLDFLKEHVANVPDPVGAEPLPDAAPAAAAAGPASASAAPAAAAEQTSSGGKRAGGVGVKQDDEDYDEEGEGQESSSSATSRAPAKRVKRE